MSEANSFYPSVAKRRTAILQRSTVRGVELRQFAVWIDWRRAPRGQDADRVFLPGLRLDDRVLAGLRAHEQLVDQAFQHVAVVRRLHAGLRGGAAQSMAWAGSRRASG